MVRVDRRLTSEVDMYFDLPGHGQTPAGEVASAEDVVLAVEAEVRERVGDEPFAVLGNSFGGMIARRVAHDFRLQALGLALIAPVFVSNKSHRAVPERTVLSSDASVLRELGDVAPQYADMAVMHTNDKAQAFLEHAHPGLAAADQDALNRISERYALSAEPETLSPEPFTQPSLFFTGRQDHVVGCEDAWATIEHYPRATFVTLDTAGHNVHLDRSGVVLTLIGDWLVRMAAS
ncbi:MULTISPECIES: alpha/beta fold hydrolase [unclassified Microbacterium]|uniref:alpha/beta fold hydrolase n=1 Tax=unclassified Microbacterium TaxID=2609290 RepID=UPI0023D9B42F|nr:MULTISPECIES: alpha/beta fold hydrolase [unclassified Microbacterium]MDF2047734.1 alpha/beta fold hydrolase [Microbacterium sp. Kw_RZR3]